MSLSAALASKRRESDHVYSGVTVFVRTVIRAPRRLVARASQGSGLAPAGESGRVKWPEPLG